MATATLFLDRRTIQKSTGKHPLKVQVYHNGKQFLTATKYYFSMDEFKKLRTNRGRRSPSGIELQGLEERASEILEDLSEITPENFRRVFNNEQKIFRRKEISTLQELFEAKIQELERESKLSSAANYRSGITAINAFRQGLQVTDITPTFLNEFKQYVLHKTGRSKESLNTYLRLLRHILNRAVSKKLILREQSPFGKEDGKVTIGGGRSRRAAINEENLVKFYNWVPDTPGRQRAKDYFFFAYFCNGIAPVDLLQLRSSDVQDGYIYFTRQKTRDSQQEVVLSQAYINDNLKAIMDRLGVDLDREYIFGKLEAGMDAKTRKTKIETWKRNTNRDLALIGKKLKIKGLNLYAARHTFATDLRNQGVSVDYLRVYLNHSSSKTTENYLNSLPKREVEEHGNMLANRLKMQR